MKSGLDSDVLLGGIQGSSGSGPEASLKMAHWTVVLNVQTIWTPFVTAPRGGPTIRPVGWHQGPGPGESPLLRPCIPTGISQPLISCSSQPLCFQNKGAHFDLSLDGIPAPASLIVSNILLLASSSAFMSFKDVPRTADTIASDQRIQPLSLPIDVLKKKKFDRNESS